MPAFQASRSLVPPCALALCVALTSAAAEAGKPRPPEKLSTPAPAVALKPPRLEKYDQDQCVSCHAEVAAEWADTAHAIAWVDAEYVAQLADKKRPETCYGCHAPRPLLAGDLAAKPLAREDARALGITCASCHVGPDGIIQGPRGTRTSAHPSAAADVFVSGRSNALCVSCHRFNIGPVVGLAKDFVEAKLADEGFSCIGCHTADVEMKFASKNGAEDPPVRKGKSHRIQTPRDPAFLRQAFDLALATKDGTSVVLVRNRTGHRVPGLIGRTIEFEVRGLDAAGKVIATKTLRLDASTYLALGEELSVALGVQASIVQVAGRHLDPRAHDPVVFVDLRLSPER